MEADTPKRTRLGLEVEMLVYNVGEPSVTAALMFAILDGW